MTYDEALAYLFGRVNFERTAADPSDLKLDRMAALLRELGNPQDALRIVHVAGSKGKGSTSAMLASVFRRARLRTGLFTSPHLCRFEERIQVDGLPIQGDELSTLVAEIAAAVHRSTPHPASAEPTFFELVTALGFLYFARRQVDVAVIEVGLGGRFDSTNVCWPLVAIITSISHDHTQQLGADLASISREKAGIIKPGCRTISGARPAEAKCVIEATCHARGAPLRQLGIDFHYRYTPGQVEWGPSVAAAATQGDFLRPPVVEVRTDRHTWPPMALGLLGEHQAANAAVAVAAIEEVMDQGLPISRQNAVEGLEAVQWPARLEIVGREPLIVLDCAHNVASAQALVETLNASFRPSRRLLIFAVSSDKDVAGILATLLPHFQRVIFTRYTSSARAMPPDQLSRLADEIRNVPRAVCPLPRSALQAARGWAAPEDLICVAGSVFLAGELRAVLVGDTR